MSLLDVILGGIYSHKKPGQVEDLRSELKVLHLRLPQIIKPFYMQNDHQAQEISDIFFSRLPDIHEQIMLDAKAAYAGDPASESESEVILAYPGFFAISFHRIAHSFQSLGVKVFPRILSEFAHEKTGIDIHPGAIIGQSFFMDHGTGIVIGETSNIGNNVKIYQGVTLGALSVSKELAKKKRHPTIQDHVVIYAGATILGGDTVIGHHSVIGGNVWLTESIVPYSIVLNKSEIKVRNAKDHENVIDFSI